MMYVAHFGLRQRPFRPSPDSLAYYPSTGHEYALASLQSALAADEGLLLVTGTPGTGKTLLCQRLLGRLGDTWSCAYLINSHLGDRTALLQAILYDLGLPHEGSEQECRLRLTEHLLASFQAGHQTLVVIDEAHHLGIDVLEELRLLGNLESSQGKAVHILLAALPEIEEQLAKRPLAAFSQRLVTRARLEPLDVHEAVDYLKHQIRIAGGRPERLFTDEALEILAPASRGVPRLLNQAAHQAMNLACAAELDQVDAEVALEALSCLGLDTEIDEELSCEEDTDPATQGPIRLTPRDEDAEAPRQRA